MARHLAVEGGAAPSTSQSALRPGHASPSGRFELRQRLGSGPCGAVYEALDRRDGSVVVLKTLDGMPADRLRQFRGDVALLKAVHHTHLLRMGEFVEEDGLPLLVTERLHGEGWLNHVRPRGQLDSHRLMRTLGPLAQALSTLHGARLLHRNIKASNVRMRPGQGAVLMHAGLATDEPAFAPPEWTPTTAWTAAGDWYAFGALLCEALTGSPPPSCGQLPEAGPPLLLSLCRDLLDADPAQRLDGTRVLRRLSTHRPTSLPPGTMPTITQTASVPATHERRARFVGRQQALATLDRAMQGPRTQGPTVCHVVAEGGLGKTRLMREACDQLVASRPDALVLWGQGTGKGLEPFDALQGVVDGLGRALMRMPDERSRELIPPGCGLLTRLFPVLGRVTALSEQSATTATPPDPLTRRCAAVEALRALLQAVSVARTVVVVIDDVHRADADSLAVLCELLGHADAPRLACVLASEPSARRDPDCPWPTSVQEQRVVLAPLAPEQMQQLAAQALADADAGLARRLSEAAAGNPRLLDALVVNAQRGIAPQAEEAMQDALRSPMFALDPAARLLLELCCVAPAPLDRAALQRASELATDAFAPQLGALKLSGLVRVRRQDERETVQPRDEGLRAACLDPLPAPIVERLHTRLVNALEADPNTAPALLGYHMMRSGRTADGARQAARAAEQAMQTLAFGCAAQQLRRAVELSPGDERAGLQRRLGDALSQCGRPLEAAEAYGHGAAQACGQQADELRALRAEQLLRSDQLQQGLEEARGLLQELDVQVAQVTPGALAMTGWYALRRRMGGDRSAEQVAPQELWELDHVWRLGRLLGHVDPALATACQRQHHQRALRAGEPGRMARSLAVEALTMVMRGKTQRLGPTLAEARTLAEQSGLPEVRALVQTADGCCRLWSGDPVQAQGPLERALQILLQDCIDEPWLSSTTMTLHLQQLAEVGNYRLLNERYHRSRRQASAQGGQSAGRLCEAQAGFVVRLMGGNAVQARTELGGLSGAAARVARVVIQRYLEPDQPALMEHEAASPVQTPMRGPGLASLQGRLWVDVARRDPSRRSQALQHARQCLSQARRQTSGLQTSLSATALEAALLDVQGEAQEAVQALQHVEANALSESPLLSGRAARMRRGQLVGGPEGAALVDDVRQELAGHGVAEPERFLRALHPGLVQ